MALNEKTMKCNVNPFIQIQHVCVYVGGGKQQPCCTHLFYAFLL